MRLLRKIRIIIYCFGILGGGIRYLSTLIVSLQTGEIYKIAWGYMNIPSLMLSIAVFVWFQYHDWTRVECKEWVVKLVQNISGACFGVYVIHYFLRGVCQL